MAKSLLEFLRIHFSNNVDIEVAANLLLDDFGGYGIVFLYLLGLGGSSRLCTRSVYHVPDLFLFKYSLRKMSPIEPVLKTAKLFSFVFAFVVLGGHCDGSNVGG